jgi:hypothetical protein
VRKECRVGVVDRMDRVEEVRPAAKACHVVLGSASSEEGLRERR